MKKYSYILFVLGILATGLGACEMRDELKKLPSKNEQKEEGWMTLDMAASGKGEVGSKAAFNPNDVDPKLYLVDIVNALTGEKVYHYDTYFELQEKGQIKLTAGKYKVIAYNYDGSEVNSSERPYFKGSTEFEILPGKTTKVNTVCKLDNIAVTIAFTNDFETQFKDDYAITVTNGDGGVKIFKKEHKGKTFYFKVPEQKNSVQLTVKATTSTNNQIAQNYTVMKPVDAEGNNNLTSGDEFTVNIGPGDGPSIDPITQIKLDITVDLTMHETGVTIEIPTENIVFNGSSTPDPDPDPEPDDKDIQVTGLPATYSFSIAETTADPGMLPTVQVQIAAPNGIKKLLVEITSTNQEFGSGMVDMGLSSFDLTKPEGLPEILYEIGLLDPEVQIEGLTTYLFDVSGFMAMLNMFGTGVHTFTLTIGDGVGADKTGALTVEVTE